MLTILTGTGREKKMQYMVSTANAAAKNAIEPSILWLAPDQFSFETERELLHRLPDATRRQTVVTGFSRYASNLMKQYGGVAARYADNLCKRIVMRRALADCSKAGELLWYQKQAQGEDFAFTDQVLKLVRQLKFSGVSAKELTDFAQTETDAALSAKASDLGNIALHYEARLNASWRDSLDDLSAAVKKLSDAALNGENYFAGKTILLDGFKSFTAPQYELLSLMLREGAAVYIALQLDKKAALADRHSIFGVTLETYDKLLALCHERYTEQVFAPEPPQNTLQAVQQSLFLDPIAPLTNPDLDQIEWFGCRDEYAEADACFGRIAALVKDSDYRYRDIAVVFRKQEHYQQPIAVAAEKYQIPYCLDGGENGQNEPLFVVCRAILQAAFEQFTGLEALTVFKSGLFAVSQTDLAALEAYLYVWRAESYADWERPFTASLSGYEQEKESESRSDAPEQLRKRWMDAISPLRQMQSATGKEFGAALYQTLSQLGILNGFSAMLQESADLGEQMQQKRVWNSFCETLTRLSDATAAEPLSGKIYTQLFLQAVQECKIKAVEQTLDCVMVGSADQIRLHEPKLVWILGANDGEFPMRPTGNAGLFTDAEQDTLVNASLPCGKTALEQLEEERFTAYQMVEKPTNKLFVSYRYADLGGEKQLPSELIWRLEALLGKKAHAKAADIDTVTPQAAFAAYCRLARFYPAQAKRYADLLQGDASYDQPLQAAKRLLAPRRYALSNPEVTEALYALYQRMLSPSEIEQYFRCPFAYFAKYGLKLSIRERAVYNPLLRGNILHAVIEQLTRPISEMAKKDAAAAAAEQLPPKSEIQTKLTLMARKAFLGELEERFENPGKICAKDKALAENMLRLIIQMAENIYAEQLQSKFSVLAVECKIGGGEIAPLRIPMDDHRALRIYGKIDRIDRCVEGDKTYFRIIDYKTGKTEFSFGAVKYGEKLQMLLYEMAVSAGGKGGFADMVPAGVLYYPARREPFAADKWLDTQALELKKRREFCMNGILIDDAETLLRVRAMEEKLQQYYIPIEDTGRELKTDSLRSPKEYQNITSYVKNQVRKMARELSNGGITPCYLTDTSPCSHCHYQGLCGKDVRIASRIPERVSEQEARDEILGTED